MSNKFTFVVLVCIVSISVMCIWSCASSGALSGGPRDTTPPKIDTLLSTKNKQVRFKPSQINLEFDEFVEVRDAIKQVLVSPPLVYIPQVKNRGKKVTFQFDPKEVLREDATYTINFGDAIVDFHESNKLSNFTFVFGTGDHLDSLTLSGNIKNALTQENEKDMLVFLYDTPNDSIVTKEKPFYFAKLDNSGNFTFTNIKSDTFLLFALKDENLNYLYDLDSEKIAFLDSLIILDDSTNIKYNLVASLPIPKQKIVANYSKTYGKVSLQYNSLFPEPKYTLSDTTMVHYSDIVIDSLNIYYQTDQDSFYVYTGIDTIKVKPKNKEAFLKKNTFKKVFDTHTLQMLPSDSIIIGYNQPIIQIDTTKIIIRDSIGPVENIGISTNKSKKELIIKYPWRSGENYNITIDSAALISLYGFACDSVGFPTSVLMPEQTSGLHILINDLDSTLTYQIKILRDKTIIYSTTTANQVKADITLKGLVPERYDIEMIEDRNKNGRWDPGSYWKKSQPEKMKLFKGEKLKLNWDVEFVVSWITGVPAPPTATDEPKAPESSLPINNKQKPKN